MIRAFWDWLRDALFPIFCVGCGEERVIACDSCLRAVPFWQPVGVMPFEGLDGLFVMYSYSDPVIKGLLRNAKFHAVEEAREGIFALSTRALRNFFAMGGEGFGTNVLVIPIPTTAVRKRERGFDQVSWIAEAIGESLCGVGVDVQVVDALQARPRGRQSQLATDEERKKNIKQAFRINEEFFARLRGANVILVDDVVTSGATMREAGNVLRDAGVARILGVSLARGGQHL